jgi:hypothetical protein
MQNDLISRSALIEELKKCTCTDKHDERIIKDFVVHIVEKQPIAYSVENVLIELEEKTELAYKRYMDSNSYNPATVRYQTQYTERKMCLDIVRNGGKE